MGYKAIIVPDGHIRGHSLINLIGFVGDPITIQISEAPGTGLKYIVTQKQFDSYHLLIENGFRRVLTVKDSPLSMKVVRYTEASANHPDARYEKHITIEEALEAINRGDYITEDFLNAVDGK